MSKEDWGVSEISDSEPITLEQHAEKLIEEFSRELRAAHKGKYDMQKAESTAALCLEAQKVIAEFLAESELISKEKKLLVESIESEQYFYYKQNASEKVTDQALNRMVGKDEKVKAAKHGQYEAESGYNKWKNLLNTLRDGHVYFRSIGRGKSEW